MKKIIIYSLVLCLILFASSAFAANYFNKPRLAVRAFDNKTDNRSVPAGAITEMMTTELYNSGLFSLMEREKFNYVREELELGMSEFVDQSTAPQMGRVKGAEYTMTGAVTVYFYNTRGGVVPIPGLGGAGAAANTAYVTLDIRIIDNTTSEVVYAAAETGKANRAGGGLITKYGGFAAGDHGGILASATRDAVMKHVKTMEERF
ncbi:MAG: CsgG/HfaB family protein [Synergistaceae bacterium]|nr:CsgG/HfaB family protein [Synergistaceae bacterium]